MGKVKEHYHDQIISKQRDADDSDYQMHKKRYECQVCRHAIYYSKAYGWRCGPGCDRAVKGNEIRPI